MVETEWLIMSYLSNFAQIFKYCTYISAEINQITSWSTDSSSKELVGWRREGKESARYLCIEEIVNSSALYLVALLA